jgi:hypothetical protein
MSNKTKKVQLSAILKALPQEELDEAVSEAKADEASEINNSGREAQIAYLLRD